MATLSLKSLTCAISEGDIFDDAPVLQIFVDGETTPHETIKIGAIGANAPHSLNSQYTFNNNVLVRLFDTDTVAFDEDDQLGDVIIKSTEPNTTNAYKAFTKDDASYNLVYALSGAQDMQASAPCYQLKVVEIVCLTSEDTYSDDHLLLTATIDPGSSKEPVQYTMAPTSLDNQDHWTLNPNFVTYFKKSVELKLQNLDGTMKSVQTLTAANQSAAQQRLQFTYGKAAYDLFYQLTVIKAPTQPHKIVNRKFALADIQVVKSGAKGPAGVTWQVQFGVTYGNGTTDAHNETVWTLNNVKDGTKANAAPDNQCATKFPLDLNDSAKTLRISVSGTEHSTLQTKPANLPFRLVTYRVEDLQKDNTWVITAPDPPSSTAQFGYIIHFKITGADS